MTCVAASCCSLALHRPCLSDTKLSCPLCRAANLGLTANLGVARAGHGLLPLRLSCLSEVIAPLVALGS